MTSAFRRLDPYYQEGPAEWLCRIVQNCHGIQIIIEESLYPQEVAASRQKKIIWVRPGLPIDTLRRYISDAVWYIRFGEEAAPMFAPAPRKPWLAASDGVTVPHSLPR
jgi:hypothetical protein